MKKLKPNRGHVILKPLQEGEQMYNSRIILPDLGNEKPELATVIEVSDGTYNYRTDKLVPLEVKIGDVVIVPKMGATKISVESEEYYIAQADQISANLIEEIKVELKMDVKDLLNDTRENIIKNSII